MIEQPYIQIYPGDELKLRGHLPLFVYGGFMKLRFRMWNAAERGVLKYDMPMLMRAMGADDLQQANDIVNILCEEMIFSVLEKNNNKFLIFPQMQKEAKISAERSKSGSKGGSKTQAKNGRNKNFDSDFAKANNKGNSEANLKQNPEYEIEYEIENKVENEGIGVQGEGIEKIIHPAGYVNGNSVLLIADCLEALFTDYCQEGLAAVVRLGLNPMTDMKKIKEFGEVFNLRLASELITHRSLSEWCSHFYNWLKFQNINTDPKTLSKANGRAKTSGGTNATATVTQGRDFYS